MPLPRRQVETRDDYDWMDRQRFLSHYMLELDREFTHEDNAADWARNGHRFWGQENAAITLEKGDPDRNQGYPRASAALSPDNRFLAVSTNAIIRLYDVKRRQVVLELKGHDENVEQMHFAPLPPGDYPGRAKGGYTLVSSGTHDWAEGRTHVWHLEESGQRMSKKVASTEITALTKRAMKPIAQDLLQHHKMAFHELKDLRESMEAALRKAVSSTRAKEMPMLRAELPIFGFANPISNDGKKLITIEKNESTQSGMRPFEEMPRIVVRDLETLREEWRLTGHQDLITWAGWSPDDKWIAEASWDETFGIWNPKVRDQPEGHLIGPSGNQNWVGDFSADGKYIVFSGGNPVKVAIYEVATGKELFSLPSLPAATAWIRELRWSPIDHTLAVIIDHSVIIWQPFEDNTATTVFTIHCDGTLLTEYNSLLLVKWEDEGQKLVVRDTANTVYVWDIKTSRKWRFERPEGKGLGLCSTPSVFLVKRLAREAAVLSLDDDGVLRFWYL